MIVYRDKSKSTSPRVPLHLSGAADLCRRDTANGRLVAIADPIYLGEPDASAQWHDLGDDWEVCLARPMTQTSLNMLMRRTPAALPFAEVVDAKGFTWYVLTALDANGKLALPVPFGKDPTTGQWRRAPTAEQATWIAAAEGARAEIAAERLSEIPIDVAAEWASTLLAATYHVTTDVLAVTGLLDDKLALGVMLCNSGIDLAEMAASSDG